MKYLWSRRLLTRCEALEHTSGNNIDKDYANESFWAEEWQANLALDKGIDAMEGGLRDVI